MENNTVAKKPSIARNGIFYLVFSVLNALFPFLTSLYVARVLSSDAIGQVSYAINIVTYFSIFAFVGIPTYGMREIAKCRDDKISLNKLFTELFTINTVTTTIALGAYIGLVFIVPNFHLQEHLALYLFSGILIVLNYFNITWLYEGVEKFSINAIVNVCTKLISFIFLVLFVKSEEHTLIYAILAVVGFSGYYYSPESGLTLRFFQESFSKYTFIRAITNTLKVGFLVGILSALVGLLFAYVEVYVKVRTKFMGGLFKVVSMLPVVSPPFVLSLSMIMLFGKAGIITRHLLGIYDNNVYGFWGIAIVQTMTFFPVCYMMFRGLLKNIDPSMEEAARDMGASRWKVFTSVTFPLLPPSTTTAIKSRFKKFFM